MRWIVLFLSLTLLASCKDSHEQKLQAIDTLRFFAIGDWGRDGIPEQMRIASAMKTLAAKHKPDFVLSLGDNFYPDGIDSPTDPQLKTSFENIYNESLSGIPWYVALGNHDYETNPQAEIDYSLINKLWIMPSSFFTTVFRMSDGAKIRIVVLDTNPFDKSYYTSMPGFAAKVKSDTLRQKIWMDSVFALKDAIWTIVAGHHPIYTGGLHTQEVVGVRNSLQPVFTKYDLPAYFAGHDHNLQHLKSADFPTHQFVSGAGSELRPATIVDQTKFAISTQGFMAVEVTRSNMSVYTINYKLDTLYQIHLVK